MVNLFAGPKSYIRTAESSSNPLVLKQVSGTSTSDNTLGISVSGLSSLFDILSFRIAEATQKWKEVTQCAKQGYKEQLEAHFNVKLSEALSDHCRYIGGTSSGVTISEVLNTNLESASTDIKGKGVGGSFGSETFETNEHGVLMCIYHVVPVLDYLRSGQDLQLLSTLATDIPIPEFDHIGMEALPTETLFNEYSKYGSNIIDDIPVLGYVPRYIAYKTSVDWVSGAFETTLDSWVAPLTIEQQTSKLAYDSVSGGEVTFGYSMPCFISSALSLISSGLPCPLITIVLFLPITTFSHKPSHSWLNSLMGRPLSSDIIFPPVNTAISCIIS